MEGADAIVEHAEAGPAAPRNILLLSKMEVTRKGRAPDTFTRSESPAAAAGLLRPGKRGHRFVEYFHDDAVSKFYFDSERYYKDRPGPEVEAGYLAEVRDAMDVIVEVLGGACPQNEVTYAIAQRHGLYVPDIKKGTAGVFKNGTLWCVDHLVYDSPSAVRIFSSLIQCFDRRARVCANRSDAKSDR
jgi:hypothetical protein